MEDKNLNANQSIELIQQMIRGTRRRLSFGSSNLFLLWGYLLAATAIGIFVLLKTTARRTSVPGLGFVEKANLCLTGCYIIASAILIYALASYDFSLVYVASYTDRLLEQIWGCIAALVVLSAILVLGYDTRTVDPHFPALLPIGAGITRDSWLNADPDYNLLQFAAAILIGLTGAGYALKRQVRRDADEGRITNGDN